MWEIIFGNNFNFRLFFHVLIDGGGVVELAASWFWMFISALKLMMVIVWFEAEIQCIILHINLYKFIFSDLHSGDKMATSLSLIRSLSNDDHMHNVFKLHSCIQ